MIICMLRIAGVQRMQIIVVSVPRVDCGIKKYSHDRDKVNATWKAIIVTVCKEDRDAHICSCDSAGFENALVARAKKTVSCERFLTWACRSSFSSQECCKKKTRNYTLSQSS